MHKPERRDGYFKSISNKAFVISAKQITIPDLLILIYFDSEALCLLKQMYCFEYSLEQSFSTFLILQPSPSLFSSPPSSFLSQILKIYFRSICLSLLVFLGRETRSYEDSFVELALTSSSLGFQANHLSYYHSAWHILKLHWLHVSETCYPGAAVSLMFILIFTRGYFS